MFFGTKLKVVQFLVCIVKPKTLDLDSCFETPFETRDSVHFETCFIATIVLTLCMKISHGDQ